MSDWYFKPIFSIGEWEKPEEQGKKYLCMSIPFIYGCEDRSEVSVNVLDGRDYL